MLGDDREQVVQQAALGATQSDRGRHRLDARLARRLKLDQRLLVQAHRSLRHILEHGGVRQLREL